MLIDPEAKAMIREYSKYTWTPTHRKDNTMDKDTIKHIVDMIDDLNGTETLLDVLAGKGVVVRPVDNVGVDVIDKKPSILDEEWEVCEVLGGVRDKDNNLLSGTPNEDWYDPIATLPDCLRALVMVRDAKGGWETHPGVDRVRVLLTPDEWKQIDAALKKAGIE